MEVKSWGFLIVGIIALTAFMASNRSWGKWIFGLVVLSALLLASNKLINKVNVTGS